MKTRKFNLKLVDHLWSCGAQCSVIIVKGCNCVIGLDRNQVSKSFALRAIPKMSENQKNAKTLDYLKSNITVILIK